MLVQQKAQIGRGLMCGGQGKEHGRFYRKNGALAASSPHCLGGATRMHCRRGRGLAPAVISCPARPQETTVNALPDKRLTGRIAPERKATAEDVRCKAIDGGSAVPDISRATYGET